MADRKLVDLAKYRVCTKCGATKHKSAYYTRKTQKYAFPVMRSTCSACVRTYVKGRKMDLEAVSGKSLYTLQKSGELNYGDAVCGTCGTLFAKEHSRHRYCSFLCKSEAIRKTAESQYEAISGNWRRYLGNLTKQPLRRNCGLTVDHLIDVLEKQGYRCALSGEPLTCFREKGIIFRTNASIDRIDPKGPYTEDNIQLVCVAVNKFRIDMDVQEYIDWCRKVAEHAKEKV